ncbi:MAG: hypothetical protein AAF206_13845 [Bacteroidota bacterium]
MKDTLDHELKAICSFDLSAIFQDLTGSVAFTAVFREYGDYPADHWYNEFCKDYIRGFTLQDDGKLQLLGSKELFGCSTAYQTYKDREKRDYQKAKVAFQTKGEIELGKMLTSRNLIRQLGSQPRWIQSDETPNVKDIRFIGQMDSGRWIEDGPYLFLFIDPENKILYQVEQF